MNYSASYLQSHEFKATMISNLVTEFLHSMIPHFLTCHFYWWKTTHPPGVDGLNPFDGQKHFQNNKGPNRMSISAIGLSYQCFPQCLLKWYIPTNYEFSTNLDTHLPWVLSDGCTLCTSPKSPLIFYKTSENFARYGKIVSLQESRLVSKSHLELPF